MDDQLIELLNTCKLLKSDFIITYNNIILGCDRSFVCLKKLQMDHTVQPIAVDMLVAQKQIKEGQCVDLFDKMIYDNLIEMLNCIDNMLLGLDGLSFINIQEDSDFDEALHLKTAQGIKYVNRANKYLIPMYNGLLPIVKSDKIDLCIYDLYDNYRFLCKFIVHKKKNINIETYLLCRYMHNKYTV